VFKWTLKEIIMKKALIIISLLALAPLAHAKDKVTVQDTLHCKAISECPYIFDVLEGDKTFKKALQDFAKQPQAKKDRVWLVGGGTATPSTPVVLGKTTYAVFGTCEPHNCGSNHYVLAYDAKAKKIYGLNTKDTPSKKQVLIGKPSAEVAALLKSYEEGDLLSQLNKPNVKLPLVFKAN
jgi:hypothetical protein